MARIVAGFQVSVMLFADDPVVIRSATQALFGITKVDRVDGAKVCVRKSEEIFSCRRGAAGESVFGLFGTKIRSHVAI